MKNSAGFFSFGVCAILRLTRLQGLAGEAANAAKVLVF